MADEAIEYEARVKEIASKVGEVLSGIQHNEAIDALCVLLGWTLSEIDVLDVREHIRGHMHCVIDGVCEQVYKNRKDILNDSDNSM